MAKTYTSVPNVATGDVYTASTYNTMTAQNINNLRVVPSCQVRLTTSINPYTSNTAIAWSSAGWDTEGASDPMWASGNASRLTIRTTGLYLVTFLAYITGTATMDLVAPNILKNGTDTVASNGDKSSSTTSDRVLLSDVLSLTAGDYLEARVFLSGGSAFVMNGAASGENMTRMTATWQGQVS